MTKIQTPTEVDLKKVSINKGRNRGLGINLEIYMVLKKWFVEPSVR